MRVLLVLFTLVLFTSSPAFSLTVEEIIRLKGAGVSEEIIALLIEKEAESRILSPDRTVGMGEIILPDGRRNFIYYSVTSPTLEKEPLSQVIIPFWAIKVSP